MSTIQQRLRPYLRLAGNVLRSNGPRLAFPYKLTFVVTYRCNYRCETCNIWQRTPSNELTLEEIQGFFRALEPILVDRLHRR